MGAHRRHYPTDAKIRAITPTLVEVARECGLDVSGIEVGPDGTIRIMENRTAPKPANDFDRWADKL